MPQWVIAETGEVLLGLEAMLAATVGVVIAAQSAGAIVHSRTIQPAMGWKTTLITSVHQAGDQRPRFGLPPMDATHQLFDVTTRWAGMFVGLAGALPLLVRRSSDLPAWILPVAGTLVIVAFVFARRAFTEMQDSKVLSRRAPHLILSACLREVASAFALTIVASVVARTTAAPALSVLDVFSVALSSRLVAAVPIRGSAIAADLVVIIGLSWVGIPIAGALAAVVIVRFGQLLIGLSAILVASRVPLQPISDDIPAKDGVGRVFHRAVFTLVGCLPQGASGRVRRRIFDSMFSMSHDPWSYAQVPYEFRKQQYLMNSIGIDVLNVVEVGSADGHNVEALAHGLPNAKIVGTDISTVAVSRASNRLSQLPNVRMLHASDSQGLDNFLDGPIHCLVLSEVLYYMGNERSMRAALKPLQARLSPDARVVMIHGSVDAVGLHTRAARVLGLTIEHHHPVPDPERPFHVAIAHQSERM